MEAVALLRMYWCWAGVWDGGGCAEGAGRSCSLAVTALLSPKDRAEHCRTVTETLVSLLVPKSLF